MTATVIRCPGCGAADTSLATPSGVHTCVYCGVRYQFTGGTPRTIHPSPGAPAAGKGARIVAVVAGLVVLLIGGGVVIAMRGASPSSSSSSRRAEVVRSIQGGSQAVAAGSAPVVVQASAEETAPATAEYTLESVRTSSSDALWVYGYLHNTSPFALGKTKITAVFYDKEGKEIGQDSGYTEDDVIAADARVPGILLVSDAPEAYDRIAFEVKAQRPSYLPARVQGLELEADAPRRDSFLGWKYSGKVHNKSGEAAKFVKVVVLGFDQADKLAGHAYTYASADALADGATARFDGTLIDSATAFRRFEFRVEGRPVR